MNGPAHFLGVLFFEQGVPPFVVEEGRGTALTAPTWRAGSQHAMDSQLYYFYLRFDIFFFVTGLFIMNHLFLVQPIYHIADHHHDGGVDQREDGGLTARLHIGLSE